MKPVTIFTTISEKGKVIVTNAEIAEISDKAYWAGYRDGLHRSMMSMLQGVSKELSDLLLEQEGRSTE